MQWYASVQPVVIFYSFCRVELNFSQTSFVNKLQQLTRQRCNEKFFLLTFVNKFRARMSKYVMRKIISCIIFVRKVVTNDYILIINLMHWLLFIHRILFSSTCFEPQVLIFRRIQLYTCSIWYCHSL